MPIGWLIGDFGEVYCDSGVDRHVEHTIFEDGYVYAVDMGYWSVARSR